MERLRHSVLVLRKYALKNRVHRVMMIELSVMAMVLRGVGGALV